MSILSVSVHPYAVSLYSLLGQRLLKEVREIRFPLSGGGAARSTLATSNLGEFDGAFWTTVKEPCEKTSRAAALIWAYDGHNPMMAPMPESSCTRAHGPPTARSRGIRHPAISSTIYVIPTFHCEQLRRSQWYQVRCGPHCIDPSATREDPNSLETLADLHLKSQLSAHVTACHITTETSQHQYSHARDSDFTKYCWLGSPSATTLETRGLCAQKLCQVVSMPHSAQHQHSHTRQWVQRSLHLSMRKAQRCHACQDRKTLQWKLV